MKHSLKEIFQNLRTYLLFVFFSAFILSVLHFTTQLSFEKINNLYEQKALIITLTHLDTKEETPLLIQFNSDSAKFKATIIKLKKLYEYSVIEQYLLQNKNVNDHNLKKLASLKENFIEKLHVYYINLKNKNIANKKELYKAKNALNIYLDKLIYNAHQHNKIIFDLFDYFYYFYFVIALLLTFLYRKRLSNIYKDITYLISFDKEKVQHRSYTQEADAIALRMKRKTVVSKNSSMIDQVTGINNYQGLLQSFTDKKILQESNVISVTVLEIDSFSKTKRTYAEELTQAILKKVAFTISLHEKTTDIIARTDYNQFTIVLARNSKEEAFKDTEIIKQNIEEIKFNIGSNGIITTTGAFVLKSANTNIEEALKQAKNILDNATKAGKISILHTNNKLYLNH